MRHTDAPDADRDAGDEGLAASQDPLAGVARDGLWNLAATVLPGVYAVLLAAYLLRSLGPSGYATWALALVLIGWLAILDSGLTATTTRESARALAGDEDGIVRTQSANSAFLGLGVAAVAVGALGAIFIPHVLRLEGTAALSAWFLAVVLATDLGLVIATSGWVGILRGGRRFDLLLGVNAVQVVVALALALALLPIFGIVGAALGQLCGRIAARATLAWLLRRRVAWFQVLPLRPTIHGLRAVWTFSMPILALQLAAQVGMGTDVLIVGAAGGATLAGLYAAGAQFVRYVSQFVFPAIGVLLPSFAAASFSRPGSARHLLPRALRLTALFGTTVFGGLALEATTVLELWAGSADVLSVQVLMVYALAYVVITPAHVQILMLIAHGRHGLIGAIVLAEAFVNLTLSLVLVARIGPLGAAVSSLIVVLLDDLVVIPVVASRRLGIRWSTIMSSIALGVVIGMAILVTTRLFAVDGAVGLFGRAGIGAAGMLAALYLLWRRPFGAGPPAGLTGRPHIAG